MGPYDGTFPLAPASRLMHNPPQLIPPGSAGSALPAACGFNIPSPKGVTGMRSWESITAHPLSTARETPGVVKRAAKNPLS